MQIRSIVLLWVVLFIVNNIPAANQTITVNTGFVVHTLPTNYHGINYTAFWDNSQGSAASRIAFQRAGVQIIRFPGGVPGNYYDWNQSTTWTTSNTDSIAKYALATGARVMFQTDPCTVSVNDQGTKNDPSGTHVAAWVNYCKSKAYDVPLWEIGNEPEGMAPANWNLGGWDSTQMR